MLPRNKDIRNRRSLGYLTLIHIWQILRQTHQPQVVSREAKTIKYTVHAKFTDFIDCNLLREWIYREINKTNNVFFPFTNNSPYYLCNQQKSLAGSRAIIFCQQPLFPSRDFPQVSAEVHCVFLLGNRMARR